MCVFLTAFVQNADSARNIVIPIAHTPTSLMCFPVILGLDLVQMSTVRQDTKEQGQD